MSKAKVIKVRIDPALREEVEGIFRELGLTATEAICLFYHQVKLHNGLPFAVRLPNKTTSETFKDTDAGKNLVRCEDAEDMFCKLGI